jgi:hypothetical protein
MHSAGATLGNAASEFGARQSKHFTDNPEQWHFRFGIDFLDFAIDV